MANIISLQFSDTIQTNVGKLNYTGDTNDNTDIEYWIGTNGYSVPYSDIRPAGEVTSGSSLSDAWTRDLVNDGGNFASPQSFTYTNYSLLPNHIALRMQASTFTTTVFVVQAENDQEGWVEIGRYNAVLSTSATFVDLPLTPKFWTQGYRITLLSGPSTIAVHEIYMYGGFRREDNTPLGSFPPNSTIENVKDSLLGSNSVTGPLSYQTALTSRPNSVKTTSRTIMTGDITISNSGDYTVLSYDPNGSNRNLILPEVPKLDHYIRIINLDGAFAINVRETVGGPIIQELSNASSVLTLEAIWVQEDSTWQITA